MEKPLKITSFVWRREISDTFRRAGFDAEDDAAIAASLIALAHFLEDHGLTKRKLLVNGQLTGGNDFELWSSDLTEQGLAVIRAGFGAWEKKSCPANDLGPLEKAYKKLKS